MLGNATRHGNDNNDIVVVLYEYQPNEDGELYLRPGEYIRVLDREDDGWWIGENNGSVGRFPRSFVDVAENAGAGHVSNKAPVKRNPTNDVAKKQRLEQGVVKCEYYPKQKNELRLNVGEFIIVLKKYDGDMWLGQRYSRSGWFPKECVEVTKTEELQDQDNNPEDSDIHYEHAVAKLEYKPNRNDELYLNPGNVLLILEKEENRWKGRIKENQGLFPKSSIETIGNSKDNTEILIGQTETGKDNQKKVTIKSQFAQYKEEKLNEFLQCTSSSQSSSSTFQIEGLGSDNSLMFTEKAIWARRLNSAVNAPLKAAARVSSSCPPPSHWGFILKGENQSKDNSPVYLTAQLAQSPNDASSAVTCHVCISIKEAARFFCNNIDNKNVWVQMPRRRNNIVTVRDVDGKILPLDDHCWEDLQKPMNDYELKLAICETDGFKNPYNLLNSNCQNFATELWESI